MKAGTKVEYLREHASLIETFPRCRDGVLFAADDRLMRTVVVRNHHVLEPGDRFLREIDAAAQSGEQATGQLERRGVDAGDEPIHRSRREQPGRHHCVPFTDAVSGDGARFNADPTQCCVEQPAHRKERDRTAQHGLLTADDLRTG